MPSAFPFKASPADQLADVVRLPVGVGALVVGPTLWGLSSTLEEWCWAWVCRRIFVALPHACPVVPHLSGASCSLLSPFCAGIPVVIANDPDGDRLAAAERQPSGDWHVFSGNDIGALLGVWQWEEWRRTHPDEDASNAVSEETEKCDTREAREMIHVAMGVGKQNRGNAR